MNRTDHNRLFNEIISDLSKNTASGLNINGPDTAFWANTVKPKLLLHACCAPCASICMDRVRDHFDTTVYFFNPNITIREEYEYRLSELRRLIDIYNEMEDRGKIDILEGEYDPDIFFTMAKGYEECPERGARCHLCYEMRLKASLEAAEGLGADYYATTLTLSPLKDAAVLNEIGYRLAQASEGSVKWLPSDFKKEDGYKKSIELSKKYGLYRQNYCGCLYSRQDH
ncbi:MAG: epoxyqueuosine reductase QueH [Lachnospiraceae bacterium]|nr:epoxyqueuosine reductase QueH [Lachnospiraceae bacterium]